MLRMKQPYIYLYIPHAYAYLHTLYIHANRSLHRVLCTFTYISIANVPCKLHPPLSAECGKKATDKKGKVRNKFFRIFPVGYFPHFTLNPLTLLRTIPAHHGKVFLGGRPPL